MLRPVDFLASDVPSVPVPVTLLTYVDSCALGIDVDTAAIPDYQVLHDDLVAGFDEVLVRDCPGN